MNIFTKIIDALLWYFNLYVVVSHDRCEIKKSLFGLHIDHIVQGTKYTTKHFLVFDICQSPELMDLKIPYFSTFEKIVIDYENGEDAKTDLHYISKGKVPSKVKLDTRVERLYKEIDDLRVTGYMDTMVARYRKIAKKPFDVKFGVSCVGTLNLTPSALNEEDLKKFMEVNEEDQKVRKEEADKRKGDILKNLNSKTKNPPMMEDNTDKDVVKPTSNGWYVNVSTGRKYQGKKNLPKGCTILDEYARG